MSEAYLLQVLLTQLCQDQTSHSGVNGFFWMQLLIYIYRYMCVCILFLHIYTKIHIYM